MLLDGPDRFESGGAERGATSYRAELLGLLAGLREAGGGTVTVHAPSENLQRLGEDWIHSWAKAGWNKRGGPIEQLDLIRRVWEAMGLVQTSWVRAERNNRDFDRARELARRAAKNPQAAPDPEPAPATTQATLSADPSRARVVAYTDGGCRGNPGVGGWGFLLIDTRTGLGREQRGAARETTNNRMELTAAIRALDAVNNRRTPIEIRTDSQYVIRVAEEWMAGWKARGWTKSTGEEVMNLDLVRELDALMHGRHVVWRWVRGHSGEPGNEYVDALANRAMDDHLAGREAPVDQRHERSPVLVQRLAVDEKAASES